MHVPRCGVDTRGPARETVAWHTPSSRLRRLSRDGRDGRAAMSAMLPARACDWRNRAAPSVVPAVLIVLVTSASERLSARHPQSALRYGAGSGSPPWGVGGSARPARAVSAKQVRCWGFGGPEVLGVFRALGVPSQPKPAPCQSRSADVDRALEPKPRRRAAQGRRLPPAARAARPSAEPPLLAFCTLQAARRRRPRVLGPRLTLPSGH